MKTVTMMLPSINDVKSFVDIANEYNFDMEIVSGKYVINAKSIMGIFSLDLNQPIVLQCEREDPAFFKAIDRFLAK